MRVAIVVGILFMTSGMSRATCPSACVAGGGPASKDCFVQFGGITATKATCLDGDPACDTDEVADGVCTFDLQACVNVPSTGCTAAPLTAVTVKPTTLPAEGTLQTGLTSLVGNPNQVCTSGGFAVPLKGGAALAPVKPGLAKFKVTATATSKDVDKLKLTCQPGAQLARDVQPILTAKCATSVACHTGTGASGGTLEVGAAYGNLVGVPATISKNGLRVKPKSVKGSWLSKKILGVGITDHSLQMPNGCPQFPPATGCLTAGETAAILSWIQRGAPND